MIGVIVTSHCRLAHELLQAAESIIGPCPRVVPVGIYRDSPTDEARQQMQQAFAQVSSGNGVIILTDIFGGTPTNIATDFLSCAQVEILTGVSLPMLIKCIGSRGEMPVSELAGMLKDYARNAVMRPTELLGR